MLNRYGFKSDPTDFDCFIRGDPALFDRVVTDQIKSGRRRIDRTGRAFRQAAGMIGVRMCEYDGCRSDGAEEAQPIGSAIDHDARTTAANKQSAMAVMAARAR